MFPMSGPIRITKEQLRAQRIELGLSQAELATELGVARGTITRWEVGSLAFPPYLGEAMANLKARFKSPKKK